MNTISHMGNSHASIGYGASKKLYLLCYIYLACTMLLLSGCTDSATPQSSPFASGGLGLTRGEWERQHTSDAGPVKPVGIWYDSKKYLVTFWSDQPSQISDSPISAITILTDHVVDALAAKQLALTLLPTDAYLQRSETSDYVPGATDYYFSSSLSTRYHAIKTAASPWRTQPAGTIMVDYGSGRMTTHTWYINISAGETGIPPSSQTSDENVPSTSTRVPSPILTVLPPLPLPIGSSVPYPAPSVGIPLNTPRP